VTSKAKASSYFRFPRVTSVADDEGLITDEDQNQVENAAKLFENCSKCTRSRAPMSEPKHRKNVPKQLKKSTKNRTPATLCNHMPNPDAYK